MAKNKTTETNKSVENYLNTIAGDRRRADCIDLLALFSQQTNFPAKMWGTAIVGFGSYHYIYESGHEGDAPLAAFSARKNAIVLYFNLPSEERESLLEKLGKYKSGKSCVYIQKLSDIDSQVLAKMISRSVTYSRERYPE